MCTTFSYPFISWGPSRPIPFPRYCDESSNVHDWVGIESTESLGCMLSSGIAGSLGSFLRIFCTDFRIGYPGWHSYRQQEFLCPHSCQHFFTFVFLMITILMGMRETLKIVLICICLMAEGVEHFLKMFIIICILWRIPYLVLWPFFFWLSCLLFWYIFKTSPTIFSGLFLAFLLISSLDPETQKPFC